jgi:hypothetical protein
MTSAIYLAPIWPHLAPRGPEPKGHGICQWRPSFGDYCHFGLIWPIWPLVWTYGSILQPILYSIIIIIINNFKDLAFCISICTRGTMGPNGPNGNKTQQNGWEMAYSGIFMAFSCGAIRGQINSKRDKNQKH